MPLPTSSWTGVPFARGDRCVFPGRCRSALPVPGPPGYGVVVHDDVCTLGCCDSSVSPPPGGRGGPVVPYPLVHSPTHTLLGPAVVNFWVATEMMYA
jgi:hypothetical protein